jgi:8-oxo-dGTP diphosphatase
VPEKLTMPELQKLYEIILGKKLNRGNFYRKILRYDILKKLDESRKGGAHKAPDLYEFNVEKYQLALTNGFNEGW